MHAHRNGYLVSPLGNGHARVGQREREADLRSRRLSMAERPCSSRHALTTTCHCINRRSTEALIYLCTNSKH